MELSAEALQQQVYELRQRVAELEGAARERDALRQELDRLLVHKHAIEAVQRERYWAQQYLNVAGVIMMVLDPDGNILMLNPRGHQVLGYPDGELLGENWFERCLPEAERSQARSCFDKLLSEPGTEIKDHEYSIQTVSGECRQIAWHCIVLTDHRRNRVGILSSGTDVTDQKRIEAELWQAHEELEQRVRERTAELARTNEQLQREIEERRAVEEQLAIFRRFADSSAQGFGIAGLDQRAVYVNPALCRIVGEEEPEAMLGQPPWKYLPPGRERFFQSMELPAILRDGQWLGEVDVVTRQGVTRRVHYGDFLIRDERGQPAFLATVITDISELRAAEDELRSRSEELRAIYDGMVDGVLLADVETRRFVKANSSVCQMLGYDEAELLAMTVADITPPDWQEVAAAQFAEFARSAGPSNRPNLPLQRKDGSLLYVDIGSNHILYHGRPCLAGFLHDVTLRNQALEDLRREQQALTNMLAAADRERQLTAYEIHDGLIQVLMATNMNLETYERRQSRLAPGAEDSYHLARRMLREAILEGRKILGRLRIPAIDRGGVVAAIVDFLEDRRHYDGLECEFEQNLQSERLPPALENAVLRIVQESVTNVRRHSQSRRVRVVLNRQDDSVQLEIRDWGIGFLPQVVPPGTLGLEDIRIRSRLLGGALNIENAPDGGTRILVNLPLAAK